MNIESITVRFDKKKRIIIRTEGKETTIVLQDFIKKSMRIAESTVSENDIKAIVEAETQKRIDNIKDSPAFAPNARKQIILSVKSDENQRKIYNEIKNHVVYSKAKTEGEKAFDSYFNALEEALKPFTYILNDIEPEK